MFIQFYIDETTRSNGNLGDNNCASKIRVNLDTKKLAKVKDWNVEVKALRSFMKIVNDIQPLIILAKSSILIVAAKYLFKVINGNTRFIEYFLS